VDPAAFRTVGRAGSAPLTTVLHVTTVLHDLVGHPPAELPSPVAATLPHPAYGVGHPQPRFVSCQFVAVGNAVREAMGADRGEQLLKVGASCRDIKFEDVGSDWQKHVRFDERYLRPTEVDSLIGDASKAQRVLGWTAKVHTPELAKIMVEAEDAGKLA